MAQIKMDVSEYELMKENKRLLEKSLEKERSLQKQIEVLNAEKLAIAESSKMKVTKITKSEKREHLIANRWSLFGEGTKSFMRDIAKLFGIDPTYIYGDFDRVSIDEIMNTFFSKTESNSITQESVTTHGLDEVKEELRVEYEKTMTADIKQKLKDGEDYGNKYAKLLDAYNGLRKVNRSLVEDNRKLFKDIDDLVTAKEEAESEKDVLLKVRQTLTDGYTMWNRKSLLDKLIKLIKIDTK